MTDTDTTTTDSLADDARDAAFTSDQSQRAQDATNSGANLVTDATTTTDHTTLIDADRIRRANDNLAGLQLAARDAAAEVAKAEADTKAAHAAAQAAADGGAGVDKLLELEADVETAERRKAVAQRIAIATKRRLDTGVLTHASEVKQSHGQAMNAAMTRLLAVRTEALTAFDALERLQAEHREVIGQMTAMANVAKCGLPNYATIAHRLLDDNGKLMDQREFDNRLNQLAHHEWDREAGKLRWVE